MHKTAIEFRARLAAALAAVVFSLAAVSLADPLSPIQVLSAYREQGQYSPLRVLYPADGTIFPPEIVPCTFSWQDDKADTWLVVFDFADGGGGLQFFSERAEWTPSAADWETIKRRSRGKPAKAALLGFLRAAPTQLLTRGWISISTSEDEVGAPLFYREVNLPFVEAVKDPSRIRWRFGAISSSNPPPVVLEHLPVCGNCHSFSQDGQVLGMDVDYANDKGSYVMTRVTKQMALASSDILTWDDYRRQDGQQTLGLLSQVSPDGQAAISTVKDKSVFVPKPDLAFSQLFFPIKGILAVYQRRTGQFQALPGADDPEYVQSNPCWSPDGQYIVFARSKAYALRNQQAQGKLLLGEEDCAEFLRDGKPFKFDLYRIPYNGGRGGKAEALTGASRNGRSNFFPKYSPDGKWVVFCQASNYMLLQPDSELFIIPAAGGEARRLRCNTARMNSWHSWSPNSRWLVFSSKANTPYTQLFLTHIDGQGESSPPVLLAHFTAPDRAANIPEFVNAPAGAIEKINEQFLNDYSHVRAAFNAELCGDTDGAMAEYEKALAINPQNAHAHQRLGFLLYNVRRQSQEGLAHTREALRLDPKNGYAHCDLGMAMRNERQLDEAALQLAEAVRLSPTNSNPVYNPADMRCSLGEVLLAKGQAGEAAEVLSRAIGFDERHARAHYYLALAQAAQGRLDDALKHYSLACSLQPSIDTVPELHLILSVNFAAAGQMQPAIASAQKALALAQARGNSSLVQTIQARLQEYQQKTGSR